MLAARGANFDAIAEHGVSVATPDRTLSVEIDIVEGVSALRLEPDDVVVLCVKSQDTVGVLEELLGVASPATAVFCAQNGVANERFVSQHFVNTYGVCVMSPASYLEPGRIEVFSAPLIGVLDVGRWPRGVDDTARVMSGMLEDSGFASMATEEIETLKWGKLLSNVMNAFEVLCGTAARDDELEERIRDEAATCLVANGVDVARARSLATERSKLIIYHSIAGIRRSEVHRGRACCVERAASRPTT